MFPSPYFYPQSLVSNLDPGAALYLYRGPLRRPRRRCSVLSFPRIFLHGLQGANEPPPLPPLSGVFTQTDTTTMNGTIQTRCKYMAALNSTIKKLFYWWQNIRENFTKPQKQTDTQKVIRDIFKLYLFIYFTYVF